MGEDGRKADAFNRKPADLGTCNELLQGQDIFIRSVDEKVGGDAHRVVPRHCEWNGAYGNRAARKRVTGRVQSDGFDLPDDYYANRACQRSRSEEHTSELQSLAYLVCRLLLEKKKQDQQVKVQLVSCE